MASELRMRYRWLIVAILAAPALGLFAYSLRHPGIPGKDDQLFPQAPQTPSSAPSSPWLSQDSGTTASLRGIYAVDDKTAWASGTKGTILKTTDAGAHWQPCSIPPDAQALDFRGIQAWDDKLAIVMSSGPGDQSRLYQTKDGCKTWTLLLKNPDSPNGFFDSFFADWSEETGTPIWTGSLLGDPVKGRFVVLDTSDSGATWKARKTPDLALGESLGGFAASNSLFPANQENSHNSNLFVSGGKSGAIAWIESLPQHTWRTVELPIAHGSDSTGIFAVASHSDKDSFRNVISTHDTLIAVGGDYAKPNESAATAAWSSDGGLTWTASSKPPNGYRSSVAWSNKTGAWIAVGINGSDISRDDGKTWQPLDDPAIAGGNWNALSLPFAVGPKGRIARLTLK